MTTDSTCRVYRVNGIEIDRDAGVIRRNGGEETRLRHKSHRLLLYLIQHREAPVPKDELIKAIWDGAAVSDDTLVNCVQEIRKALGDDARSPSFVRTMPKTGYWFVAPVETEIEPKEQIEVPPSPPRVRNWVRPALVFSAALIVLAGAAWWLSRPAPAKWDETSWWKFDEGSGAITRDSITGRETAVPPGVSWEPGAFGDAVQFNGYDVALTGPGSPAPPGPISRTLIAWIKTGSNNADATTIFQYGSPNPNERFHSFALFMHQTGVGGVVSDRATVTGRKRLDDGHWHQIAGVFAGATRRASLFVDGVEEASGILSDASLLVKPDASWSIGRAPWGGTPFRGAIDDVRIFERALHAAEIHALHRCASANVDIEVPGRGGYYFAPVFSQNVSVEPRGEGETSARLRHTGRDYGGVSFARRQPGCGLVSTLAGDLGQDLTIEAELRVGGNNTDQVTEAGPYFRSRRSTPGDGILGGTSAGYWVQLKSTGQIRVRRLYPSSTIAFSEVPAQFDPNVFHKLAASAKGDTLTVALDGRSVEFDQGGVRRTTIQVAATWESAAPKGKNQGAAGIAFSCEGNRSKAGGQEIRNIRVTMPD